MPPQPIGATGVAAAAVAVTSTATTAVAITSTATAAAAVAVTSTTTAAAAAAVTSTAGIASAAAVAATVAIAAAATGVADTITATLTAASLAEAGGNDGWVSVRVVGSLATAAVVSLRRVQGLGRPRVCGVGTVLRLCERRGGLCSNEGRGRNSQDDCPHVEQEIRFASLPPKMFLAATINAGRRAEHLMLCCRCDCGSLA